MEEVVDKLIAELTTFAATLSADGGCSDILAIEAVYFGDPIVIPVNSYPCFMVVPDRDIPVGETTSYDIRDLTILVTLAVDAREFFDASALEATGDRVMVQVMNNLRTWLRTSANRQLDGLSGVREVRFSNTDYLIQPRDTVIAKVAQITLTVNRQFSRKAA